MTGRNHKIVGEIVKALKGSKDFRPTPLVSTSPSRDPRFADLSLALLQDLGSVVFMPLFSEEELLGGLYVDLRREAGYFHQPELDFVVAFATAAAMPNSMMAAMPDAVLERKAPTDDPAASNRPVNTIVAPRG